MSNSDNIEIYKKALSREKNARKQAEQILEEKALELFESNLALKNLNGELEKKLEERIAQIKLTESQFEKVVYEANDIIYKIGLTGDFTYVNHAAMHLTGYSESELLTKNFIELVITPSPNVIIDFYKNQLNNSEQSSYFEYEIKTKSNQTLWLGQNIQLIELEGKVIGFSGIARNITDRVNSDELLRKSEEKYRQILENMELGLIEVNVADRISKVYDSFCLLTGYNRDELLGKNPNTLLTPDSLKTMNAQNSLRKKGFASVYEVELKKKSGELIWLLISGAPFYNEFGKRTGSIGVHLDITSRKKAETQLEKSKDLAEASSKSMELFLANMSHEIRTPLNAVIGLSQILVKTSLNTKQSGFVQTIKNSAGNLLSLVNDILDFSKIEAGEMQLEKEAVNILELGESIIQTFNYQAIEKNIDLVLNTNVISDTNYQGDRLRLTQVLMNLVNNSLKFTEQGSVELTINQMPDKSLYFEVKDTGIGIRPEMVKTIFKKFRQEEESTGRKYGGTGLGLNIAQSIVLLYKSELKLNSVKNEGTSFFFTLNLPIIDKKIDEKNYSLDENLDWSTYHILLAEDNKVNQLVASSFLEEWGVQLTICNNGLEAFQLLESSDFDLILMDIQMPVMNGLDATIEIREHLNKEIPIIALTANAVKGDKEKYLKAGMNDHVSKPFHELELKKVIAKLISQSKSPSTRIKEKAPSKFLNLKKLQKLGHTDPNFITKMLQLFADESKLQLIDLEQMTDHNQIAALAHKVKPSIDYIGNKQLGEDVRRIENKEFVEDWSLLSKFILDWQKLEGEVSDYLS